MTTIIIIINKSAIFKSNMKNKVIFEQKKNTEIE